MGIRSVPSRPRVLLGAAALAAVAAGVAPSAAAGAGKPFTCEAGVLRGMILTAPPIAPIETNRGKPCATTMAGLPSLPGNPLVRVGTLQAVTQLTGPADRTDLQQAVAAGGLADLGIGPLATLGLNLPLDQVPLPDALKRIEVDISPITGPLNAATGALPAVPPVPVPVPGLPVPAEVPPVATLTGAAKLPDKIVVDIEAAVRELVKLPKADVFAVKGAVAVAGARCIGGKPVTGGQRTVGKVSVLGNEIDVDTFGDRPVVDTQTIDPSQIDLTKVKVPVVDGLTGGQLSVVTAQVNAAVAAAIKALPPIGLPVDLLRVSIRPGTQTKTADALTQTALDVKVTALGMNVVDLSIGDARVGTAGVDCAPPPAAAVAPAVVQAPAAPLACTTRRLVLTDVVRKGSRVTITGVADKRFVGRFVSIRFEADGRTAGRAMVASNGVFRTTTALPSRALRSSNRARYQAVLGKEKSLNLKLERRMFVDRLTSATGKVTVAGRVTRPLGSPVQTITLTRRVTCKKSEVVARFKPRSDGRFSITVAGPEGQTSAVYRLGTQVRKTVRNRKLFPTFTLPQGVDLVQ